FFPAATGIMVGVGMSGSLDDPRRAVPRGTLGAWGTTLVIYSAAAVWYGTVASREELLANKLAMVDHALFGPLVLFGLLSSTLMAALSSLVAAPRLLAAMAELRVVPFADRLSVTTEAGEPRNAALATLAIAAVGLLAGSLDAIAPIITSFFIMTYLAVNVVVFVEQWLKLVSWRPTFEIRTWVPAVGAIACLLGLVLSSPAGGLPEVVFVGGIWLWLTRRRHVETPWETVQSGIAQDVAAWAVLRASQLKRSERSWKPDLMIPVSSTDEVSVLAPLAEALTETRGSVRWIMLRQDAGLEERVHTSTRQLEAEDVLCSSHEMVEDAPGQGLRLAIHAMKGTLFAPNLVLFSARHQEPGLLLTSLDLAKQQELGAVLALDDPQRRFGATGTVTVWLSDRSPSWELGLHVTNLDLPVLIAWLLTRRQKGRIRLATVLRDEEQRAAATAFLEDLVELGRLANTTIHVLSGSIDERLRDAPPSDLHVLGMPETVDLARLLQLRDAAGGPCLFVRDSGHESALA
ncbi:MAG: hypothetical protein KC621_29980, partial [Myxococcales bacterium]|nr:hypothetical protein [Myxococcales bacterium]